MPVPTIPIFITLEVRFIQNTKPEPWYTNHKILNKI